MAGINIYNGVLKYLNTKGEFDVIYPVTYAKLVKLDDEGNFLDKKITSIDTNITNNANAIKAINDGADKAKGFVKLDDNGLVPAAFIPAQFKEVQVVATIAARDAIANPFTGMSAFVEDASGDTTVNSGGAYYIYNGTAWVKTAEAESMDVVLQWTAIQGKPDTLAGYGITDGVNKAGDTMTGALILSGAPAEDLQAATKAYVDSVVQGLDIKESVRCASVENITLSGAQTIDGIALAVGDRVLVKSQTNAAENGIYVVAEEAWTRAADAANGKITSGMFTFVEEGNVNANSGFVLATDGAIAVGTTELQFSQFSGMGQVLAGTGIGKNGNEIYIKDTGVTAGTYTKLTVNAQGQVTAATNLTPDDLPEIAWAVITGKPTSTVEDIDDAVAKKHAHANSAQLDKVGEADGNLTYDSKTMATQEFVQSMIQVSPTEPANLPVGGIWIKIVEDTPQGN